MVSKTATRAQVLARFVAGLGIAFDAGLFVLKAPGAFTVGTHLFALWLMAPWLVVIALAWRGSPPGLATGVVLCAALEGVAFYTTFVSPQGPTAALVFAAKPVWQTIVLLASIVATGAIRYHRRRA